MRTSWAPIAFGGMLRVTVTLVMFSRLRRHSVNVVCRLGGRVRTVVSIRVRLMVNLIDVRLGTVGLGVLLKVLLALGLCSLSWQVCR